MTAALGLVKDAAWGAGYPRHPDRAAPEPREVPAPPCTENRAPPFCRGPAVLLKAHCKTQPFSLCSDTCGPASCRERTCKRPGAVPTLISILFHFLAPGSTRQMSVGHKGRLMKKPGRPQSARLILRRAAAGPKPEGHGRAALGLRPAAPPRGSPEELLQMGLPSAALGVAGRREAPSREQAPRLLGGE